MNEQEFRASMVIVKDEVADLMRRMTDPMREVFGGAHVVWEGEAEGKARSYAKFYKGLLEAEIDKETALKLTQSLFVTPEVIMSIYRDCALKQLEIIRDIALAAINPTKEK